MMRKSLLLPLCLLLVLLAAAAVGIVVACEEVSAGRDQVVFTETTLYGDRSAAAGMVVGSRATYENHLHWDTTCRLGAEPQTETVYRYTQASERQNIPYSHSAVQLSTEFSLPEDALSEEKEPMGIAAAYQQLLDRTPAGDQRTGIFTVRDYCDYYPLSIVVDLPGMEGGWVLSSEGGLEENPKPGTEAYTLLALGDYFRIPVIAEEQIELSVSKNSEGELVGSGSNPTDGESDCFWLWTESVLTEDACYFTFNTHTSHDRVVDTGSIPGGYGIYCLPYTQETEGEDSDSAVSIIEADTLSMVYPLDPQVRVMHLALNPDQSALLLYTAEEGRCMLTVIDSSTMDTRQRLEIAASDETGIGCEFYQGDDFLVVYTYSDREQLTLLAENADGTYVPRFTAALPTETKGSDPVDTMRYPDGVTAMDYDGSRLAIASVLKDASSWQDTCGFYAAVYDASGLRYFGQYTCSLDAGFRFDSEANRREEGRCRPVNYEPIRAAWDTSTL